MAKFTSSLSQYKSLFPYFAKYRKRYVMGLTCLIIVDAAQIAIPQFIRRAIDLISYGVFEWGEIIRICLLMVGTMALIALGRFFWRYCINGSSRRIETEIREKLFRHLQTLSWDFYQKNKIGDLMARSTNDLNAVRMSIGLGLVAFVDFIVMSTAIFAIIFAQDARSALYSIIPLPLVTTLILLFGKTVGKRYQSAHEAYSKMSDTAQETFTGLRVIKSFVKEWWFIKKFAADNDEYRRAGMELVRLWGFFFPIVTFLSELTILLMLVIGGTRVINGLMSPGSLVAMFRYLHMLIWPLMGAGFMVNLIQRGAVSLGRVNEILDTMPTIRDIPKIITRRHQDTEGDDSFANNAQPSAPPRLRVRDFANKSPAIKIKDLSFSYGEGNTALSHINLSIAQGEWLGIMGKTGSGKSTLIKTLTRMLDPDKGTVAIFGADTRHWPLADLRRQFAVSPQDSYLFSDSIQNNIGYGLDLYPNIFTQRHVEPSVRGAKEDEAFRNSAQLSAPPCFCERSSENKLKKAIQIAALDRDIAGFAEGEGTLIGEKGLTLSGGQKQRVAVARSLVPESEILILDDSLSAVDAETERKILDSLLAVRKGGGTTSGTTIIISHRVSTLCNTDKVIVLDSGKQSEYGTPGELAAAGGFYSRMAALQRLDEGASH